jgi:type III pantothenate kinase
VIDIGNTRTKLALFNPHDLMFSVPVEHLITSHLQMLKDEHVQMDKVILSSVQTVDESLLNFLEQNFKVFIELNHQTKLPIENLYQTPETLGNDRIAAAVGANELFPDQNILIIDLGTAITYDLVSAKNQFIGGNISPGLQMRFKALNHYTSKLPLVGYSVHLESVGRNTTEAIRAGVQNGVVAEICRTIEYFDQNYADLQVVMTGGDCELFEKQIDYPVFVHFNLTLVGLNRILKFNSTRDLL